MYGNIKHVGLHAFQLQLIKEDYYSPPIKKSTRHVLYKLWFLDFTFFQISKTHNFQSFAKMKQK